MISNNNNNIPEIIPKPKATSSLSSWLSYLANLHPKIIDLGLERIGTVACRLDLLNPVQKVITVAGTNGKGTTCHTLESILIEAGLKVGVYSSPHLLDYNERVRIQGNTLPEEEFCRVFANIEEKRGTTSLTCFEYGTLAALQLFKQAELDIIILEVGLGGRLDATNIIDANIAAITSIGLDHIDWLGNDREQIGYQKAGIFRSGQYAVVGEPDIPKSIHKVAEALGTKLFSFGIDWQIKVYNNYWQWQSINNKFQHLPLPNVPLVNAATALAIVDCLIKEDPAISKILSLQAIHKGLIQAKLAGRFQVISQQPYVVLDVAHNPHAVAYLAKRLAKLPRKKNSKVYALVAMLIDKDIGGTIAHLAPQIDKWYVASLSGNRGANAAQLAKYIQSTSQFITVKDAWLQVMADANKQDIVVVCGSFQTVAKVIELQSKEKGIKNGC